MTDTNSVSLFISFFVHLLPSWPMYLSNDDLASEQILRSFVRSTLRLSTKFY